MRRQWLFTQAMFCICKISQDWMQRDLLAKHSKSLDDIAMEKHYRILWCFVASHPQYCQYIFPFPDVSKNFSPSRAVQLVHAAECRHNAEEYKLQIVCRTVVIDTGYLWSVVNLISLWNRQTHFDGLDVNRCQVLISLRNLWYRFVVSFCVVLLRTYVGR